ncbi:MAG: ATP synthase F1 subunit delta [Clostridiales bacterium]
MKDKNIANRYAKALFDIGVEKEEQGDHSGICQVFHKNLKLIYDTISTQHQAKAVFSGILLPVESKKNLAEGLFTGRVEAEVLDFFMLLLDKDRLEYLKEIIDALEDLVDERYGFLEVRICSAVEITEEQEKALIEALNKITGKKARLAKSVDDQLIGGMVMTIGDTVYDGSIQKQLAKLEEELVR